MASAASPTIAWHYRTATSDFGHFPTEVPESLHIGTYRRYFCLGLRSSGIAKPAANMHN